MDRKTNRQGRVFVLALAMVGCWVDVDVFGDDSDGGEAESSSGLGGSGMIAGSSSEGSSEDAATSTDAGESTGEPPPDTTGGSTDTGESSTGGSTDTGEPACVVIAGVPPELACVCGGAVADPSECGPCEWSSTDQVCYCGGIPTARPHAECVS